MNTAGIEQKCQASADQRQIRTAGRMEKEDHLPNPSPHSCLRLYWIVYDAMGVYSIQKVPPHACKGLHVHLRRSGARPPYGPRSTRERPLGQTWVWGCSPGLGRRNITRFTRNTRFTVTTKPFPGCFCHGNMFQTGRPVSNRDGAASYGRKMRA